MESVAREIRTGQTYWEYVNEEGPGNHDPVYVLHRVLR